MAANKAITTVNYVNQQTEIATKYSFGLVDEKNFKEMGAKLQLAPTNVKNAWIDALNLVGLQLAVQKRVYESYFRKLHGIDIATFDVQLMMVELFEAKQYSPYSDADRFFQDAPPEVVVQYLSNIERVYWDCSINETALYGAFLTTDSFDRFFEEVQNKLYSSMEKYDVDATKKLLEAGVESGNVYIMNVPKPVDKDTSLGLTKAVKQLSSDIDIEYSNQYNIMGANTITNKDEGILICTTDVSATADTYSLPWMFNMSLADLRRDGMFIEIPSTGLCGGKVYAMYVDRNFLQIHKLIGFPRMTSQNFADTLTNKEYLHYQAMYNLCYFVNAIAFAESDSTGLTGVTLSTRSGSVNINRGSQDQVYVETVIADGDKIYDKFGKYEIDSTTNVTDTKIDENSGKIRVGKNETASTIKVNFKSHLNENVTGSVTLTVNGN